MMSYQKHHFGVVGHLAIIIIIIIIIIIMAFGVVCVCHHQ